MEQGSGWERVMTVWWHEDRSLHDHTATAGAYQAHVWQDHSGRWSANVTGSGRVSEPDGLRTLEEAQAWCGGTRRSVGDGGPGG